MNMLHVTLTGGPLKLGLILASYPDVLPINLSRKSEGDIGALRDLALSVSFVATKHLWVNPEPLARQREAGAEPDDTILLANHDRTAGQNDRPLTTVGGAYFPRLILVK